MVDLNLLYEAILGGKLEQSVEVTNQAMLNRRRLLTDI